MEALTEQEVDRVIEMAWEDRTPFEAITFQFGMAENEIIELMRKEMKRSSFQMWRKRVTSRTTLGRDLISVYAAFITAIFNIVPNGFPLFSPPKRTLTNQANFFG